ncbi:MAG: ribonuclease T2 family protein [Pseudolabrys sp.]
MLRSIVRFAVLAAALCIGLNLAAAQTPILTDPAQQTAPSPSLGPDTARQDRRQNQPGQFDFYILALSWSPSFCESSRERNPRRTDETQCGPRPYSFVVHGLWPQYERGFPSFCQVPPPRLNRDIVGSMLELMPSPRLVYHEWDRHGTCSGLSSQAFFDSVRKARAAVRIPEKYINIGAALTVTPGEVADAFVAANPGLTRGSMAVACDSRRLNEVRICLNKDFSFRDCSDVARRSCRRDTIVMPPVRGNRAAEAN